MQEEINKLKQDVEILKAQLQTFNMSQETRNSIQSAVIIRTDDTSEVQVNVELSGLEETLPFAIVPEAFLLIESNGKLYKVAHYGNV